MFVLTSPAKSLLLAALLCACAAAALAQGATQTPTPDAPPQDAEDEVIKVDTALIQTGVAVFDKKGQFVGNLKQEDFEVTVDGKPVPISFFEQYTVRRAGVAKPAPGGRGPAAAATAGAPPSPVGSGRNILFVVDDIHLSHDSHNRVRKLISQFIDQQMTADDTVAVVSSSGKIGFLQQFTGDRTALRAAVARLRFTRDYSAGDRTPPPISEYEALLIDQYDPQVTDAIASQESGASIETNREIVRSRARIILSHAAATNRATYSTLEQAVRRSAALPGRKLVFFISDGWLLDTRNTDASYRLRRITDAAARTNAVIYSFDPKGLEAGFPDNSSRLAAFRVQSGARFETQDGLNYVADKTGGKFIKNMNDLQIGLTKSLEEASQHYLLAWRPVSESGKDEKWREIEIKVRNRPDLTVRAQGGYLGRSVETASEAKTGAEGSEAEDKKGAGAQAAVPPAERQLNAAAAALTPARELPVSLTVSYLDLPLEGASVTVALQIDGHAVEFTPEPGDKARANIDLVGMVYNADGKREKYQREQLTLDGPAAALKNPRQRHDIIHTYPLKLTPGLYQVRVAARDVKSGRVGSAVQWVEIPDLTARRLATSSVIISERTGDAKTVQAGGAAADDGVAANTRVVIDRRVARNSHLRYITFVYNASRGKAATMQPDVTVQTQILRGGEVVVTSPPSRISVEGKDPERLPYAAEISLDRLPAGRYELLVIVQDRIAKADSAQRVNFEIK